MVSEQSNWMVPTDIGAQDWYRALVHNSHDIIYTIRPDGMVTYVSPSYTRLVGHEPSMIVGNNFRDFLFPDDIASCVAYQEEVVRAGEARKGIEYRIIHRDGSIRWHRSNFMPCRDENGRILCFVGNAVDITEQKQRQAQLDAARVEAETASVAKSEFLALISHEIRTPLNALVGFSSLASGTEDPTVLRQYLAIIDQSARSLMDLVNDILDIAKIEAGKLTLDTIPCSLKAMVNLLTWQYGPLAVEKGLGFRVLGDEALPAWVRGDPLRLRQIFANLIANALKFTEKGCVTLRVTVAAERGEQEHLVIRFAIHDTGIGIAKEKLKFLFQPFNQLEPGTARKYGGSGLGLAIVANLTQLMEGRVAVVSTPGEGTCFTIELPFVLCDPPEYRQIEASASVSAVLDILVVEDNQLNRRMLIDTLVGWGHRVSDVKNGLQALALVEQNRYDFIFIDIRMPDMDGIELTSRLRRLEREQNRPPTSIIACTADSEHFTREQSLEAGMQEVLFKPFAPDTLKRILDELQLTLPGGKRPVVEGDNSFPLADRVLADMEYNQEKITLYLGLLRDDMAEELGRLEEAVLGGNRVALKKAAHTLKGLCGYLRDPRPVELARRLYGEATTASNADLLATSLQMRSICARADWEKRLNDIHGE